MSLSLFFLILALLCLLGVVFSLFRGLFAMTQADQKDRKTSNKMMQLRVLFQGLTLLFLFLSWAAR